MRISVTYGGSTITARIYERLRKGSYRRHQRSIKAMLTATRSNWPDNVPPPNMFEGLDFYLDVEHKAYQLGVKDALNALQEEAIVVPYGATS